MANLHIRVGQALREFDLISKQQAVTEIVAESPEIIRINILEEYQFLYPQLHPHTQRYLHLYISIMSFISILNLSF